MALWTTDRLIETVKRKAFAPARNWPFTDAQVLDIAWEETMKRIVPAVRAVRENYWTTTLDIPLTILSTGLYPTYVRIPTRAAASTATSVWVVLTDGSLAQLTRIAAAERQLFSGLQPTGNAAPNAYSLEGDKLYLYPPANIPNLTIRIEYDRRPAQYVPVSECALITSTDQTTSAFAAVGGTWVAGANVTDIVQGEAPCDVLAQSLTTVSYAAGTFTYDVGALTGLGVTAGCYITQAGTTCILPLPDVLHLALADLTVAVIKSESKDFDRAASLRAEVAEYMPGLIQTLAVRVSADPMPTFNRQSPLRTGFYGPRWGRR